MYNLDRQLNTCARYVVSKNVVKDPKLIVPKEKFSYYFPARDQFHHTNF